MSFFSKMPLRKRERLLEAFQAIADRPVILPDDLPTDADSGRRHWLRSRDGHVIEFWIDHAVKEVRVMDMSDR